MTDSTSNDDPLSRSLGMRVRALREKAGLDGTALAAKCGMKQPYLSRVESGRTLPSVRTLAKIAVALNVPLPLLFDEVDYSGVQLAPRNYVR